METDISGAEGIMQIQWGAIKKAIEEYIRNQLQEDIAADQISFKEYIDPFTGSKNKQAKKTAARERLPVIVMRC